MSRSRARRVGRPGQRGLVIVSDIGDDEVVGHPRLKIFRVAVTFERPGRVGARARNLSRRIMFPEMARRTSSSGEAGGTANVTTLGPIAAIPNAGTRLTTRHVNPTPPAAFALNSAKASTILLCCCGARVCKGCNREKADDRQITHCVCPPLTAYPIWSVQTGKFNLDLAFAHSTGRATRRSCWQARPQALWRRAEAPYVRVHTHTSEHPLNSERFRPAPETC